MYFARLNKNSLLGLFFGIRVVRFLVDYLEEVLPFFAGLTEFFRVIKRLHHDYFVVFLTDLEDRIALEIGHGQLLNNLQSQILPLVSWWLFCWNLIPILEDVAEGLETFVNFYVCHKDMLKYSRPASAC